MFFNQIHVPVTFSWLNKTLLKEKKSYFNKVVIFKCVSCMYNIHANTVY